MQVCEKAGLNPLDNCFLVLRIFYRGRAGTIMREARENGAWATLLSEGPKFLNNEVLFDSRAG